MSTSTFVFLDTNILFRYVTQGQPGCEPEHWEELKRTVDDSSITLLVPEVVALEFEKKVYKLEQTLAGGIGKAEEAIKAAKEKANLWNELGDLFQFLEDQLVQWKRTKIDEASRRKEEVERFLSSEQVIRLDFDQNIMCRSKRRMLAGRVKLAKDRGDADCFIIVMLASYFEGRGGDNQLLFCTENHKEFGLEVEGTMTLHPLMKEGLPPTEMFENLADLVTALRSRKPVEEPAPEEVEAAANRQAAEESEVESGAVYPSAAGAYLRPDMELLRGTLDYQEEMARLADPIVRAQQAMGRVTAPLARSLREQEERMRLITAPLAQRQKEMEEQARRLGAQLARYQQEIPRLADLIVGAKQVRRPSDPPARPTGTSDDDPKSP